MRAFGPQTPAHHNVAGVSLLQTPTNHLHLWCAFYTLPRFGCASSLPLPLFYHLSHIHRHAFTHTDNYIHSPARAHTHMPIYACACYQCLNVLSTTKISERQLRFGVLNKMRWPRIRVAFFNTENRSMHGVSQFNACRLINFWSNEDEIIRTLICLFLSQRRLDKFVTHLWRKNCFRRKDRPLWIKM